MAVATVIYDDPGHRFLRSITRVSQDHDCRVDRPDLVKRARARGYVEVFHEEVGVLATARAQVLGRAGFAALVEGASDDWIVLARPR